MEYSKENLVFELLYLSYETRDIYFFNVNTDTYWIVAAFEIHFAYIDEFKIDPGG